MTTLVYRAGTLAADTRTSTAGIISPGATVKVRRLPDGRLAGFTGAATEAFRFFRWLEAGEGEPPRNDDCRIVVVSVDGQVAVHEGDSWFPAEGSDFFAWGSGAAPALGALYVGATAEEAVRAASHVDPETGGSVWSVSLERP